MTPKGPRKPATILRELRNLLVARGLYFTVGGEPSGIAGALLAELSRAIATSGKAPGRP